MTIKSYTMGPGTLKLGAAGVQDASCQVTSCTVTPEESVDSTDAVDVLCGEKLAAQDTATYTYTLAGTVLQDLESTGFVAYTWTNEGASLAFEFIPNTAAARKVTGTCRIVPLGIGGDAKARPTSDFSWAIIGKPVFAAAP